MRLGAGVIATHQQLSSNAHGDIELERIEVDPDFKKSVQTYGGVTQQPQLSLDDINENMAGNKDIMTKAKKQRGLLKNII